MEVLIGRPAFGKRTLYVKETNEQQEIWRLSHCLLNKEQQQQSYYLNSGF